MFAVSHFILAIARLLELVLWAYFWIIIARAVISWVSPDRFNPIVRFLYRVTMIVILVIYFLHSFLVESLRDLAVSLR